MTKEYNINELLEEKKHLEEQVKEKLNVNSDQLEYFEQKITNSLDSKNNRDIIPKKRVTLLEFTQVTNGYIHRLDLVKREIQKFNAGDVLVKLQERTAVRTKIQLLQNIKTYLPKEVKQGQKVLLANKEGVPIEIANTLMAPMFELDVVEKELNVLCAQERKLNTEVQKLNLNAKISL